MYYIFHNYRDNNIEECGLEMYFTQDQDNFGQVRTVELVPGGSDKLVTEENKQEFIRWVYVLVKAVVMMLYEK